MGGIIYRKSVRVYSGLWPGRCITKSKDKPTLSTLIQGALKYQEGGIGQANVVAPFL